MTSGTRLLNYLELYGADEVTAALSEAIERETPHVGAVRFLLERRRRAAHRPVPIGIELPDDPRVRNLIVRPHSLESYDEIKEVLKNDPSDDPAASGE